jgi:hypothetical protein
MRIGGRVFPYIAGGGIALEWLPFVDDGAAGMTENTPSPDWRSGEVVSSAAHATLARFSASNH